jgi:hypothetical protein
MKCRAPVSRDVIKRHAVLIEFAFVMAIVVEVVFYPVSVTSPKPRNRRIRSVVWSQRLIADSPVLQNRLYRFACAKSYPWPALALPKIAVRGLNEK